MTTNLIHVGAPPLSQSAYETNACPTSYAFQIIEGNRGPDSLQSDRGTEVHQVMSRYIDHCVQKRVPSDWAAFDALSATVASEAGRILDGMRDSYIVDYDNVLNTECTLMLDEQYRPTEDLNRAVLKGTLDVMLLKNPRVAKIEDFKSHPQPFDADTFQSMLYPFLLFHTLPELEEITFELVFVRYAHSRRSVTWTRSDLPDMQVQIERGRRRQLLTHQLYENGEPLKTLPGNHCFYCPLQANGKCPEKEFNPYVANSAEDLLLDLKFCQDRAKFIKDILKAKIQATGLPIVAEDNNGPSLSFETRPVDSQLYPARESMNALAAWAETTGEDLRGQVNISSTKLKGYLKAKKRAALKEVFDTTVIEKVTKVKTQLFAKSTGDDTEEDEDFFA